MRHLTATLLACALLAALARPAPPTTARGDMRLYLPLLTSPAVHASYLGSSGADALNAAAFDDSGQVLLAGVHAGATIGGRAPQLLPGGDGFVARLDPGGRSVVAAARVGGVVRDMEPAGDTVLVCGDFGIATLTSSLDAILWSDTPGDVSRCAADAEGTAALVGSTIYHYAADGTSRTSWTVPGTRAEDVAIDDASGLVFVTGYTQKTSVLKVAYLRAYAPDGSLRWVAYDFAADALIAAGLTADSEGRRLALGADGKLYFAGFADGGNALYGRDPRDLARTLGADRLIKFDRYNDPYNISGAKSLAWYGRFEPTTGELLLGQWLLTRLSDGKGNSIGVRAIAADAAGNVALAGDAYAFMEGRAGMRFANVTLGSYEGGEPYLLLVSPDFRARRLWTTFAASETSAGGSPATAVALAGGQLTLAATLNPRSSGPARGLVTTAGALQPANASPGATEGYLVQMSLP
ncbi:MAG: hypothetical protein OHK0015_53950 [Chloroflexi bacterium OHK40]